MFSCTSTFSVISMLLLSTSTDAVQMKPRNFDERELIKGGKVVTDENKEYPYMAKMYSRNEWDNSSCGATLIAPNVLLTAAHCRHLNYVDIGSEFFFARTIFVHPNYSMEQHDHADGRYWFAQYDYALVVLNKNSNASIVVLDDGSKPIDWDEKATMLGYGSVGGGSFHGSKPIDWDEKATMNGGLLQEAKIDIMSKADETCSSYWGAFLTNHMICAASPADIDACQVVGGGPLLQNGTQIGVASYGRHCWNINSPGVYARVSAVTIWIKSMLETIKTGKRGYLYGEGIYYNCMAGSTRVVTPEGLVRVDELEVGMQVMGITAEDVQDPNCNVVAIGSNGVGTVYGNYTSHHFVRQDNAVSEHGENGERRTDSLFDVLLDCPFGVDEVGYQFSAMANYHAAKEDRPSASIDQYLTVYKVLLGLVKKTGTFWMYSESYKNITDARIKESDIIDLMMECLDSNLDQKPCMRLEEAAKTFVEEQFPSSETTMRRTLFGANNITIMEETDHDDGLERGSSYGDIIKAAFPMLGSPTGGNGTVVYALRQGVQKSGSPPGLYAVLSTVIVVASISVIATIMIVRRNRRNGKSKEVAPELIE